MIRALLALLDLAGLHVHRAARLDHVVMFDVEWCPCGLERMTYRPAGVVRWCSGWMTPAEVDEARREWFREHTAEGRP
jgi:hypothetical protein